MKKLQSILQKLTEIKYIFALLIVNNNWNKTHPSMDISKDRKYAQTSISDLPPYFLFIMNLQNKVIFKHEEGDKH